MNELREIKESARYGTDPVVMRCRRRSAAAVAAAADHRG
jgi:hypothetical protein